MTKPTGNPRNSITILAAAFVLLLFLPLWAPAVESDVPSGVELTLRNEEQSNAKVALAYLQGNKFIVEGWLRLSPEQMETITLHTVAEGDIYIYVEFENPDIRQFIASEWKVECLAPDTDFRYALESVGGKWTPDNTNVRKIPLQNIHNPEGLFGVFEERCSRVIGYTALCSQTTRQGLFSRMAKGRVAKIVRHGDGFGKVFVEPESPGDRACDL